LEDELKQLVTEVQELARTAYEELNELVKDADESIRYCMALEKKWTSIKSRSSEQTADYLREVENMQSLALAFSDWIKQNPDFSLEYLKSAFTDPTLDSRDAKIKFMRDIRGNRKKRVELQIPELREIVESMGKSVERLGNITTLQY
jgi:GrpB-like predicted nucleotidyltransferase (UPF0157 family)